MDIEVASPAGVVFRKRGADRLLGCLYRGGKVARVPDFDEAQIVGRFFFYTYAGVAKGDETDTLGLFDLRAGKFHVDFPTQTYVYSYVIKRNGSLAWIEQQGLIGGPNEVVVVGADKEPRVIDEGAIAPRSLALSADNTTLYWVKDGILTSAPIK